MLTGLVPQSIMSNVQSNMNTVEFLSYCTIFDQGSLQSIGILQLVKKNDWDKTQTLTDYVSGFEEVEFVTSQPMYFSFAVLRAINDIAISTRLGAGNRLYHQPGAKLPVLAINDIVFHEEDFVPEGYALITYEGSYRDVGFIYSPTRGIIKNNNDRAYGRLIKIPK